MIERCVKIFYRLVCIGAVFFITVAFYCSIFYVNESQVATIRIVYIMLGVVTLFLILLLIYNSVKKWTDERIKIITHVLFMSCFTMICFYGLRFRSVPPWDLRTIQNDILYYFKYGTHCSLDYFSTFPNNIPLAVLQMIWYKFTGWIGFDFSVSGAILGILCLTIVLIYSTKTVEKIWGKRQVPFFLLLFLINQPLILYTSYTYTDVLSMPFCMLGLYYAMCFWDDNYKEKNAIISTIFFSVGLEIRATVIIPVIATLIVCFLKKWKKGLIYMVSMILSMLIIVNVFNMLSNKFDFELDEQVRRSSAFFIMVGLNPDSHGGFNSEDLAFSNSYKNVEERNAGMISKIGERLNSFQTLGPYATWTFLKNKISRVWSSGTYGVEIYMSQVASGYGGLYEYIFGANKHVISVFFQIVRACNYLIMLGGIILLLFKRDNIDHENMLFLLAVLGMFMFYTFWEAQNRYSISCLPIMLIFLVGTMRRLDHSGVARLNTKMYWLGSKMIYVILTLLLIFQMSTFAYSMKTYAKERIFITAKQKCLWNTTPIHIEKEVVQTFKSKQPFNFVKVTFKKENIETERIYEFELYRENILINKQRFNSKDVVNASEHIFWVPTVESHDAYSKYYLKIKRLEEMTGENKDMEGGLSVIVDRIPAYDCYPEGEFITKDINGFVDMDFVVGEYQSGE